MRSKLYQAALLLLFATLAALPVWAQPTCPGGFPACSTCSCQSGCLAKCCDIDQLDVCANYVCRAFCVSSGVEAADGASLGAATSCRAEPADAGAFLSGLGANAPAPMVRAWPQ